MLWTINSIFKNYVRLLETLLLRQETLSLGVQFRTAQAQLQCVGPLNARAPQGEVWIRGTQNCPCSFVLKRATETGGWAMLCERSLHPAPAVQASHRPTCTPGLLKHGETWALLTALESELCPKFLQHWVLGNCLHHNTPIPAALPKGEYLASGIAALSWIAQQKLQLLLTLLESQDKHQPGHGACWAEINTRNCFGIEIRDLLGICNSLCDRGSLWALMEVKTQKSFLGPRASSEHLPGFFLHPSLVQDPCFYQDPSKQTTQSRGGFLCAAVPPCSALSPYSGSRTNSDGSLGRLIPQGLLALTRNWYWQPGDRSSMTRYVSKVEATDCCQTWEPVGQRVRRGAWGKGSLCELRAADFSAQFR